MALGKSVAVISAMLLAMATPFLYGCGSGPGSGGLERKSVVSLELNWPPDYSFDSNTSQINFASSPTMMSAPAYVTSCRVTISGADMTPVTLDVPLSTGRVGGSATPGERRFDVVVETNIGLTFTGSTTVILVSGNNSGVSIQLAVNAPPQSSGISVSNPKPFKGESVTLTATATDLDSTDTLSYSWDGGGGSISGSGPSATWSSAKSGSYTVSVTVTDPMGASTVQSAVITVINRAPVITSVTSSDTAPTVGQTVTLACVATDADANDRLSYGWSDGLGWTAAGASAQYTVATAGVLTLTCFVSDGDGGKASGSAVINGAGGVTAPGAPTGVTAAGGNTQVTVSWNAVAGGTSYNLYWSTVSGTGTAGTKITGATSPYVHTGRSNGVPYYYVVTAVGAGGESGPSAQASATPMVVWTVTKTPDTADGICDADCSLREAISAANAGPGGEMISIPAGTYVIGIPGANDDLNAFGDLDITKSVSIVGAGAGVTIIDGGALDRVLHIPGASTVSISGVTITNGFSTANIGGGIYNSGTLTITNSMITANVGDNGAGGVYNNGMLILINSTISGNITNFGSAAGIFNNAGGTVTVTKSTISGNSSNQTVGGIQNAGTLVITNSTITGNSGGIQGGGIDNSGVLTVTNSTISGNSAGSGSGIFNGGSATLSNTIVASQAFGPDCSGTITSNGYNLESAVSCGFAGVGDLINTNPLLSVLGNNGGPTQTMAPATGSPAINAGSCVTPTDQRGIARPQGGGCDIGAYEQ